MNTTVQHKKTVNVLRVLYLLWVLLGIFGIMYVPSTLIDFSDPIKTAQQLETHEFLFRSGIMARLITQFLFIIIPFYLYDLFKNLNQRVAMMMMIFAYISIPISMGFEAFTLDALRVIHKPDQMINSLEVYYQGMIIAMIFWGIWLFPLGILVYTSRLFPRFIGIALFIAGVGYVLDSSSKILFPDFKTVQSIVEMMTIGEVVFVLWLVIVGVRFRPSLSE